MDLAGACGACGYHQHGVELTLSVKARHLKRPGVRAARGGPGGIVCPAANACPWQEWPGDCYRGHRRPTASHATSH